MNTVVCMCARVCTFVSAIGQLFEKITRTNTSWLDGVKPLLWTDFKKWSNGFSNIVVYHWKILWKIL